MIVGPGITGPLLLYTVRNESGCLKINEMMESTVIQIIMTLESIFLFDPIFKKSFSVETLTRLYWQGGLKFLEQNNT